MISCLVIALLVACSPDENKSDVTTSTESIPVKENIEIENTGESDKPLNGHNKKPSQSDTGADATRVNETTGSDKMVNQPELEVIYDKKIDELDQNTDIIIREEIGHIDFKEWKENWLGIKAPETLFMMIHVTSNDYEFGPMEMDFDVYIKNKNIHAVGLTDYGEITMTYNAKRNQTRIENKNASGAFVEDGCSLPFRILGLNDFQLIENQLNESMGDFMPQYLENQDGSSEVMVFMPMADGLSYFTYKLDERVMTSYGENGMEMYYDDDYPEGIEVPYSSGWYTELIKSDVNIDDKFFEF